MDADYLRNTLGQVVARGCAETIAVAPVDPIHYLSLWLLKYVENAKLVIEFQREKDRLWQEQRVRHDRKRQCDIERTEELKKQEEKINQLRSIQKDPYLLFDECLKAILQFTGGASAYVALVLDKLWEPPKKGSDSEGGESAPNEEEQEPEEEEEVEEEDLSREANSEDTNLVEEGVDGQQEGGAENSGGENKKKAKSPKPPNYKKKILLYVAATPNNEHLINKQLDRKSGPITFSVLLKGLPKLHISNVLYQEGVHFFQGLPLMGAYLSFPISLNITPAQDEVFGQIKQCLFPTAVVYRVLKALLHVLGQSDAIIHDWTRSRQALNEDICMVMKQFSSLAEMDLKKWNLSDVFLDGITEENLSGEAPVGYLGQQWLLAAKKVAFETVKHNKYKTKREEAAKEFADAELEQMVAEIDLRVAIDEEKKVSLHLEDLQSNFAKQLASSPPDEVAVVDEDEGVEEE